MPSYGKEILNVGEQRRVTILNQVERAESYREFSFRDAAELKRKAEDDIKGLF